MHTPRYDLIFLRSKQRMNPLKIIIVLAFLLLSTLAQAEHTMAELPAFMLLAIALMVYFYAWVALYVSAGVSIVLIVIRLVLSWFDATYSSAAKALQIAKGIVGGLLVTCLMILGGSLLIVLVGMGFGLKTQSWADVTKIMAMTAPYQSKMPQRSRKEIKAELDAIPKVKNDLSWKKYSPLKQPWPEYEGALYLRDDPILPAPYSIEISIYGPRKPRLIKVCDLNHSGPCDGQIAYFLNTFNFVFTKLVEGRYTVHVQDLQTGQAFESSEFNLDDKWQPRLNLGVSDDYLHDPSKFKEIPPSQY